MQAMSTYYLIQAMVKKSYGFIYQSFKNADIL